jgi:hypothetical protein
VSPHCVKCCEMNITVPSQRLIPVRQGSYDETGILGVKLQCHFKCKCCDVMITVPSCYDGILE